MLNIIAMLISWIMHPLFIIGYVLAFLILADPYSFGFAGATTLGLVVISVLSIAIMFPMISIAMMKALGFVKSFEMHDRKERIGPLITTGLFYMWLYVNIRDNNTPKCVESANLWLSSCLLTRFHDLKRGFRK